MFCHFCKILNEKFPSYLLDLIPDLNRVHERPDIAKIFPAIHARHDYFKNSSFPSTIYEWKKVDGKIKNSGSLSIF